jgi:hypothetical protein
MVLHELACLPDHFIDESCGALGIAVSSQQREACRLHSFVGITPRRRANVLALSKAGCNEHLQRVVDANGQTLAYVYGHADPRDAGIANSLTLDEARRIASNIAKLPDLLGKVSED